MKKTRDDYPECFISFGSKIYYSAFWDMKRLDDVVQYLADETHPRERKPLKEFLIVLRKNAKSDQELMDTLNDVVAYFNFNQAKGTREFIDGLIAKL